MLILTMIISLAGFAYLAYHQNAEISGLKVSLEQIKSEIQKKDDEIAKKTSEFQVMESQLLEFKTEIEKYKGCTGIIDKGECLAPSKATRKSIENDRQGGAKKENQKSKKKKKS